MNTAKNWLKKSIAIKLVFFSTLGAIIIMTIVLIVQGQILKNIFKERQEDKITRIGKLISSASINPLLSYDTLTINGYVREIKKDIDVVDVVFYNKSGERVNSLNQKDSLTAAEKKFGIQKLGNTETKKYEFPIESQGWQWGLLVIKTHNLDLENSQSIMLTKIALIFLLGIITLVAVVWFSSNKIIINPIKKIKSIAEELSLGNSNIHISQDRLDEIGHLQKSFALTIESLNQKALTAERIADGDLTADITVKSENDILSKSMIKLVNTVKSLTNEVTTLNSEAIEGHLTTRGNIEKFNGVYREIVSGLNATLDAIVKPINESSKILGKIASGDLTVRMADNYKGDFSKIKDSINILADSYSSMLFDVTSAVQATANASYEISSGTEEMAAGAQEQSIQTTEVVSAVEQMSKTITETTRNSGQASEVAKNSGSIAKHGGKVIGESIAGMNRIADVVKKSAETVQALGKGSDKIGEIIQVINEIADQTNLLALNAAIEAARAGEQGRGFAVVADEVRKLAERTSKATKEIDAMIKQIQKDTNEAVITMNEGTKEVNAGKAFTSKAGESLNEIITSAEKVVDISTQVAAASEEQSTAAEQIKASIESINNVTRQNAVGVEQIAKTAENLNQLTDKLQGLVAKFKIEKNFINSIKNSKQLTNDNQYHINVENVSFS